MKGLLKFFLFVIVVIGGWILYTNLTEKEKTTTEQAPAPPAPVFRQPQQPMQTQQQPQGFLPIQRQAQPYQQQPQTNNYNQNVVLGGNQDKRAKFAEIAQKLHISILSYQQVGSSATITLSSQDRTALSDFLNECINAGLIRDFQEVNKSAVRGNNGALVFTVTYKLMW